MLCGTSSFKHADDDPAAPRSRANPFAARGLEKFSAVLSDLESRRDKILRRVGSDVMVRFVQSKGTWAPIIVKLPAGQQLKQATAAAPAQPAASSLTPPGTRESAAKTSRAASFSWGRMRRPACYWPAVMALTLVSLVVFGRVFAICCTSIWWYLVPTLSSSCSNGAGEDARQAGLRRSMEKRKVATSPPSPPHYAKHKVMSSPRSQPRKE